MMETKTSIYCNAQCIEEKAMTKKRFTHQLATQCAAITAAAMFALLLAAPVASYAAQKVNPATHVGRVLGDHVQVAAKLNVGDHIGIQLLVDQPCTTSTATDGLWTKATDTGSHTFTTSTGVGALTASTTDVTATCFGQPPTVSTATGFTEETTGAMSTTSTPVFTSTRSCIDQVGCATGSGAPDIIGAMSCSGLAAPCSQVSAV